MRPGERIAFEWAPIEPVQSFECMIIAEGAPIPARAFAVAVTALDFEGERIAPVGDGWFHSDLLKTECQYAPGSGDTSASRIAPWTGSAVPRRFLIEAVAWSSGGPNIPAICGLGISPVPELPGTPRTWHLLRPTTNSEGARS